MTATPIPRTLALTVYGDLAVSEIDRPPAGRKPMVTRWVTARALERGLPAAAAGTSPTAARHTSSARSISPSETIEARAPPRRRPSGCSGPSWPSFRVGCLHGQLRPAERRELMDAFARGELDVLVATTVIEVGVDVPNATIMIVQEADRFGLAQLHQLRGRVGRGAEQSYCLLVSRPKEELTDDRGRPPAGARRHDRRLRARRGRPRAARRGPAARHAADRACPTCASRGCGRTASARARRASMLLGCSRSEGPLDDEVERLFGVGFGRRVRLIQGAGARTSRPSSIPWYPKSCSRRAAT